MKKYTSVFSLIVRSNIYKLLCIMGAMTLLEVGIFTFAGLNISTLPKALSATGAEIILPIAVMFCALFTTQFMRSKHSNMQYFISKFRIEDEAFYVLFGFYIALALFLLFILQSVIFMLLSLLYMNVNQLTDPMALITGIYGNDVFHCVFPVSNGWNWLVFYVFLPLIFIVETVSTLTMMRKNNNGQSSLLWLPKWYLIYFLFRVFKFSSYNVFLKVLILCMMFVLLVVAALWLIRKRRRKNG